MVYVKARSRRTKVNVWRLEKNYLQEKFLGVVWLIFSCFSLLFSEDGFVIAVIIFMW